jgi:hypothetical protein
MSARRERGEGATLASRASPPARVRLELSPEQVAEVIRAAQGRSTLPLTLSPPGGIEQALALAGPHLRDPRLSRSLIFAVLVLACFPVCGGYLANSEVAEMVAIPPSTAHRYISTLLALGMLERDPVTRRYRRAR